MHVYTQKLGEGKVKIHRNINIVTRVSTRVKILLGSF